jgi:uncharacterized protein (TIGR00297 family)
VSHIAKAIPPERDRLQSRILVCVAVPVLCALAIRAIARSGRSIADPHRHYILAELVISVAFALLAWLLKAATPGAAACGGVICFLLSDCSFPWPPTLLRSELPPLALLFLLTMLATRYGRAKKESRGLAEPRTGRRASQVIANLGIAALCAASFRNRIGLAATIAYARALAALAEAAADTLSSEIGQAVAGPAILVTTLRRVPPGTDGAVSVAGTLAGVLGAAAIIFAGLPLFSLSFAPFLFPAIFIAGTLGLFFDSLLGATLERRGWVNNDLVNFLSTGFAAVVAAPLAFLAFSFLRI